MTRRVFLKGMGISASAFLFPACASLRHQVTKPPAAAAPKPDAAIFDAARFSPIDRTVPMLGERRFYGDADPGRAHAILWDKAAFLAEHSGKRPETSEDRNVVVIGGGMAGLTTAYLLRDLQPVLLEQGDRFGGNAKGQSWNDLDYSIGAAYFSVPDEGTPLHQFLIDDLHVEKFCEKVTLDDPALWEKDWKKDFWAKGIKRSDRPAYAALDEYTKKAPSPEIPLLDESQRGYVAELDRENLLAHLQKKIGTVPPSMRVALDAFCASTLGAVSSEVSAAAGLRFLQDEIAPIFLPHGGNAAVSEHLYRKLALALPENSLRAQSFVMDVKRTESGVSVLYVDKLGAFHRITAKAVVMACPKHIAKRLCAELESREADLDRIKTTSYVVGNFCIEGKPNKPFYDLFILNRPEKSSTDVVWGTQTYADPRYSVLSVYRPMAYPSARKEFMMPDAYEFLRVDLEREFYTDVGPALGISPRQVKDIRVSRWGHALPVAAPGLIAEGVFERARAPLQDRIFFVNQDNWALPCLETSVEEALHWAPRIKKLFSTVS